MTIDGLVVGVPAPSDVLEVAKSSIAFPTRNMAFPARNMAFPARNMAFPARNMAFPARNMAYPTRNARSANGHVNIQLDLYEDYYLQRCLLKCRIGIPLFICTGLSIFLLTGLFLGIRDENGKMDIYNVTVVMACIIGIVVTIFCCIFSLNKYDNFTQSGLVGYYQRRGQTSTHREISI
jgi:hypothetical protein